MLEYHDVDLLLDVGANIGQFAQSIREAGYRGKLVSFEPLTEPHAWLLQASRSDPAWEVAPRVAIGAHEGEVEMKVSDNSFSSSVLTVLPDHIRAAPESVCIGVENVRLSQLDTASCDYLKLSKAPFIKIDTQGYEDRVLDGATEVLKKAVGLHLELSFVPLYEGQPLFDTIIDRLDDAGFCVWGIWPGIHDPQSGRMLQIDATLFRR
jgi:FkbM family methyltransferase